MVDEMTMAHCQSKNQDATKSIINLSQLANEEFKNVDFVICMNPRRFINTRLEIEYISKGIHAPHFYC